MKSMLNMAVLAGLVVAALSACTANVTTPSGSGGSNSDSGCVKTCDDNNTSCVAKCSDDTCRASCTTTHDMCTSTCTTTTTTTTTSSGGTGG